MRCPLEMSGRAFSVRSTASRMAVEAGSVHNAARSLSGSSQAIPSSEGKARLSTIEAEFCIRPWVSLNHFSRAR